MRPRIPGSRPDNAALGKWLEGEVEGLPFCRALDDLPGEKLAAVFHDYFGRVKP